MAEGSMSDDLSDSLLMAEGSMSDDLSDSLQEMGLDPNPADADLHNHHNSQQPHKRSELRWEEKLQEARELKQAGNDYYKGRNLKSAVGRYHRALLYLRGITKSQEQDVPFMPDRERPDISDDVQNEINQLIVQCYNNLAACLLQPEKPNYTKVLQYCDNVIEISPDNVKALYRRGVAMYHLKRPEEALDTLKHAVNLPDGQKDANIRRYVQMCEKAMIEQDQIMKDRCKAMFAS